MVKMGVRWVAECPVWVEPSQCVAVHQDLRTNGSAMAVKIGVARVKARLIFDFGQMLQPLAPTQSVRKNRNSLRSTRSKLERMSGKKLRSGERPQKRDKPPVTVSMARKP